MAFDTQVEALIAQLNSAPGMHRLRELVDAAAEADEEFLGSILTAAMQFAQEKLAPFEAMADRIGCHLEGGRVVLPPGHRELWREFCEDGWCGIDIGAELGGQGLPRVISSAIQECFDRASVSFGMVPGAARSAARLLQAHADPAITAAWVPRFASGEWAATICISEPDAGSDVGRIRTNARRDAAGTWRIRGEKMWISYADHGLTERIGHVVLARPQGAMAGVRGLSLFLVPSTIERDGAMVPNHTAVRRVEEKLGLHGSPTCLFGFEDSEAWMIGTEGRGVSQLFSMIVSMRLQVGTQGLGLAEASFHAAFDYAVERRQGGPWDKPPVPIAAHADVQLTLMGMASRIATLRGLVYAGAIAGDLADAETDQPARQRAALLQAWMLPIIKNSGAETGFDVAAEALVLFGGAGYTREWPVERYLRDSRVLAIYEGTAGMQALDLVKRRWQRPNTGFEVFMGVLRDEVAALSPADAATLLIGVTTLEEATQWIRDPSREDWELEAAARPALQLATEVAHAWIGARLARLAASNEAGERLIACGRYALSVLRERATSRLSALREAPLRRRNCIALGFEPII